MFTGRQWPHVALEDADLLGRLIDEFIHSPTDVWPSVHELTELSGSQPSNPDRPIWLWLAAWSAEAGELGEPLIAMKIAAFTQTWRGFSAEPRVTALLHPLDPTSNELDLILQSAISAAHQFSEDTAFRDTEDLTAARLTSYLYGPTRPSAIGHDAQQAPIDRRYARLGADRLSLLEYRCGNQWAAFLELLEPDEQLCAAAPVLSFDLRVALLALTDRRVVIVSTRKFFVGAPTYAEIDLADVNSVRYHRGSARIAAMEGGFKHTVRSQHQLVIKSNTGDYSVSFRIGGTPRNEGPEWPTLILRQKRVQSATPPVPPSASSDLASQLERLGQLRQRGILTEAEFAAAKAKLLG